MFPSKPCKLYRFIPGPSPCFSIMVKADDYEVTALESKTMQKMLKH